MKKFFTTSIVSILITFYISKAQTFTEISTGILGSNRGSISWGDYNNDGYLDVLITGCNNTDTFAKVYKNNGNGTFTEQTSIQLKGVVDGSSAWGDYNNDGLLDIIISGQSTNGPITKIYKNNGDNTFTEQTGINLPGLTYSSVAWGDFDNDGKLDLALTGNTGTENIAQIYKNNGNNTFTEQAGIILSGVSQGDVKWGDYNKDGFLDLLIVGKDNTGKSTSTVYKNNGNGTFTKQTSIMLTGVTGTCAWGDYNADGNLDIIISGFTGSQMITKIYRNNGDNTFTEQLSFPFGGSVALGDYNNDGYLDILFNGTDGTNGLTKLYKNNKNNTFTEDTSSLFLGTQNGCATWADYNNDGKLDLLYCGENDSSFFTKLFKNNLAITANSAPSAPKGLVSLVSNDTVALSWRKATDDSTHQKSLTYNLRVGKTLGKIDIVSPMSDITNGFRRIVSIGNTNNDTIWTIKNLSDGTYYWSVQAIDNGYEGSSFASEDTFIIGASSKHNQTISFPALPTVTYGSNEINPMATASSGLVVKYSSSDTTIATIISNKIHIKGAGNCIIFANQPGNASYYSAPQESQTLTVNKKLLIAKADNKQRNYGSDNPTLTITYSGFEYNDNADSITQPSISTTANDSSSPGNYPITLTGGNAKNYTIFLINGTLTINKALLLAVASNQSRPCGHPNPTLTIGYVGFINNDSVNSIVQPQITTSASIASPLGDYSITISGGSSQNYDIVPVNGVLQIVPLEMFTNNVSICSGSQYTLPDGDTTGIAGTYTDTLVTKYGCDSIIETKLTLISQMTDSLSVELCTGDSILIAGKYYNEAGLYDEIIKSTLGCDSILRTVNVSTVIKPTVDAGGDKTVCGNNPVQLVANGTGYVTWKGYNSNSIIVTPSTTTIYTALATNSCGTVQDNIKVTVQPIPETPSIAEGNKELFTDAVGNIQWYEKATGILDGDTDWIYQPLKTGNYYIKVTKNQCQSDTSNNILYIYIPGSQDSINMVYLSTNLLIFPNPVENNINIIAHSVKLKEVEIFDIIGNSIYHKNYYDEYKASIDLQGNKSGVYLIKITFSDASVLPVIKKILKK
jgi:hypothetical protein